MPEISWRHDGRRLIIPAALLPPIGSPNQMTFEAVDALIDTGASRSGITPSLARSLKLTSLGKRQVQTASGMTSADQYTFRIGFFPSGNASGAWPHVLADEVYGIGLAEIDDFGLIVGMDVIGRNDLSLEPDGTTTFRFSAG